MINSLSKECLIESGTFISAGDDVAYMKAKNGVDECASKCATTIGCVAWTFKISTSGCWLKSYASRKGKKDGWISGTKSCGEGRYP